MLQAGKLLERLQNRASSVNKSESKRVVSGGQFGRSRRVGLSLLAFRPEASAAQTLLLSDI